MKILIIQQKWIGDVLTCSVLFEALRKEFPKAKLDYLINTNTYPVVQGNPFIDEFILLPPEEQKNIPALIKRGRELTKENYDFVIDALGKPSSLLLSIFSGAQKRISYKKWYSQFLFTDTIRRQHKSRSNAGLAIENRLALLAPILHHTVDALRPQVYLNTREQEAAKQYLIDNAIDFNRPIFMISVLGSKHNKSYPKEYIVQLLDWLVGECPKAQLLFNYIPNQLPEVESILEACRPSTQKQVQLEVYGRSLRRFMAITAHCHAVIGNEGGAINIGKALGKKTFSIFSPRISRENWQIYENGTHNVSVHLQEYKPHYYIGVSKKELKKNAEKLYRDFHPSLFRQKYLDFINQFSTS